MIKKGNYFFGISLITLIFLISVFAHSTVLASSPIMSCKYYYWIDDSNKVCNYKRFCGTFMYQGLQTFSNKVKCEKELNNQGYYKTFRIFNQSSSINVSIILYNINAETFINLNNETDLKNIVQFYKPKTNRLLFSELKNYFASKKIKNVVLYGSDDSVFLKEIQKILKGKFIFIVKN